MRPEGLGLGGVCGIGDWVGTGGMSGGEVGEPDGEDVWLYADFGSDSKQDLDQVGLDVLAKARVDDASGEADQVFGKGSRGKKLLLLAIDKDAKDGDGITEDGAVLRGRGGASNGVVDLGRGGEGEAEMRDRSATLFTEQSYDAVQRRAQLVYGGGVGGNDMGSRCQLLKYKRDSQLGSGPAGARVGAGAGS